MADPAHKQTDAYIAQIERRMRREYAKAAREIEKKLNDHLAAFEEKKKGRLEALAKGKITQQQYNNWYTGQVMTGQRWRDMQDQITQDLLNANAIARSIANGYRADVYALNINYATYQIEEAGRIDTSFTLYDKQTVERIIREDPDFLPPPGKTVKKAIADGTAKAWERNILQSNMMQSIIQGETIHEAAKRISETLSTRNYAASVRYARTAMTNAQNAGRYDGYRRAAKLGVDLKIEWQATLDNRTRHDHRMLHGQRRDVDEPFEVPDTDIKILYPAEAGPGASDIPQREIWNCRCTLLAWVKGFEGDTVTSSPKTGDLTFDEWQKARTMTKEEQDEWIKAGKPSLREWLKPKTTTATKAIEEAVVKKPVVPEFTPAKTIEEAEKFVSQFVDTSQFGSVGVSFKGVGLDVANEFNRTIAEHYALFDVDKFGGVVAPAGNTKLGQQVSTAYAGYSPVRKSFVLNRKNMKTVKTAQAGLAEERRVCQDVLTHPERYDLTKMSPRARRIFENAAESGRTLVPETLNDSINHELGHSIERYIKRSENYEQIKANRSIYGPKVSGYACDDEGEYIAESWCSWRKGETVADPVLVKAFESLMRK